MTRCEAGLAWTTNLLRAILGESRTVNPSSGVIGGGVIVRGICIDSDPDRFSASPLTAASIGERARLCVDEMEEEDFAV